MRTFEKCGTGVWKLDTKTVKEHFKLENRMEKLYKVNDLVIKCIQENITQGMEIVATEYTVQLIENFGTLDANLLMQKKTTDKNEANENFKYIISLAR